MQWRNGRSGLVEGNHLAEPFVNFSKREIAVSIGIKLPEESIPLTFVLVRLIFGMVSNPSLFGNAGTFDVGSLAAISPRLDIPKLN